MSHVTGALVGARSLSSYVQSCQSGLFPLPANGLLNGRTGLLQPTLGEKHCGAWGSGPFQAHQAQQLPCVRLPGEVHTHPPPHPSAAPSPVSEPPAVHRLRGASGCAVGGTGILNSGTGPGATVPSQTPREVRGLAVATEPAPGDGGLQGYPGSDRAVGWRSDEACYFNKMEE